MNARIPIELKTLKKHAVIIGASGSGKTVAAKTILEELVLSGVKVIAIDPQGDLASMAMPSSDSDWKRARVRPRVYTPASDAGRPLSLNPLTLPADSKNGSRMLAAVAENIAGILGYDTRKAAGKAAVSALDKLLFDSLSRGHRISEIDGLVTAALTYTKPAEISWEEEWDYEQKLRKFNAALVSDRLAGKNAKEAHVVITTPERRLALKTYVRPVKPKPKKPDNPLARVISENSLAELVRRLAQLASGSKRDLYCRGYPITIEELTKSKLSIVYLNSLYALEEKMAVVAQIATTLYGWMLTHASQSLQIVLYIDEIAQFLPAGTRNTGAKEALRLLFKQGRKYGVGVMLATQNPGDVDYRAMSQASTWMIGRLTMKQDLAKLKPLYNGIPATSLRNSTSGELGAETINDLPHADVGQFQIISPDAFQGVRVFRFPMCRTPHKTLNETDIAKIK